MRIEVVRVERDAILQLRRRVFGQGAATGDLSPATRHWAAWLHADLVGCGTVVPVRGHALRAMAVAPEHRGQGIGTRILSVIRDETDTDLWCNARLGAVGFYAHRGWVAVGPVFEMAGRGPHQRMTSARLDRHIG